MKQELIKLKLGRITNKQIDSIVYIKTRKNELLEKAAKLETTFNITDYKALINQIGKLELEWINIMTSIKTKYSKKLLPHSTIGLDVETKTIFLKFSAIK